MLVRLFIGIRIVLAACDQEGVGAGEGYAPSRAKRGSSAQIC